MSATHLLIAQVLVFVFKIMLIFLEINAFFPFGISDKILEACPSPCVCGVACFSIKALLKMKSCDPRTRAKIFTC